MALSQDDITIYMKDGAHVIMTGARSHPGNEKDSLRRMANVSRKRYQEWVESGSPPAHECRLMGEA
eukprot:7798452-Pyramimonas_sp.AAC.1